MKIETLNALRDSIEHWTDLTNPNTDLHIIRPNSDQCALCRRFDTDECIATDGERCPVYKKTGVKLCRDTPYHDALYEFKRVVNGETTDKSLFIAAAQVELEFLKSLLPKT